MIDALAADVSRMNVGFKYELQTLFRGAIGGDEAYLDIYMGFPDDTAVMGSGFDIAGEYGWWKATERSWYILALTDAETAHFTPPYMDVVTGDLMVTIAKAVVVNNEVAGVIGIDIVV